MPGADPEQEAARVLLRDAVVAGGHRFRVVHPHVDDAAGDHQPRGGVEDALVQSQVAGGQADPHRAEAQLFQLGGGVAHVTGVGRPGSGTGVHPEGPEAVAGAGHGGPLRRRLVRSPSNNAHCMMTIEHDTRNRPRLQLELQKGPTVDVYHGLR